MAKKKETYLVRGDDGRMATIIAFSKRGALKIFMVKHRAKRGDQVSVKPRGHGDWTDYKVY